MVLISSIKLNLSEKLETDKGFRSRFFRDKAQDEIAMSIKSLREKRHLRQVDLAKESNMKQSAISRIEQAEYSAWSLKTLFRVADALDARLRISFDTIENVVEQFKQKEMSSELDSTQYATLPRIAYIGSTVGVGVMTTAGLSQPSLDSILSRPNTDADNATLRIPGSV